MTHPLKILHIPTDTALGGTERRFADFIAASNPEHFRHAVLTLKPVGVVGEGLARAGFEVESLNLSRARAAVGAPALLKAIRQYKPDIVQTYLFGGNTAGRPAARLAGVPVVVSGYASTDPWMRPHHIAADMTSAKFATAHLANAEAVADSVVRRCKVPRASIEVVHTGRPIPDTPARHAARPDGTVVGIAAGRVHRAKGYDVLIEALAQADSRIRIKVAGSGPIVHGGLSAIQELEDAAERAGVADRIEFLGVRDDINALMAEGDFHVLPSRWEGLPGVLIEAMAMGLPSVASAVGGVSEALVDSKTGFLTEPGDPTSLADGLNRIATADRATLGEAARLRAIESFSVDAMTHRWENFYRRLARLAHLEGPGL
ncbi:MAG: hypothetical protein DCC49_04385 [Acidobacteria bacterium]|nr:MAG: hypothetical protein DCC49_04385 [Acidobacteriota bacterium]